VLIEVNAKRRTVDLIDACCGWDDTKGLSLEACRAKERTSALMGLTNLSLGRQDEAKTNSGWVPMPA